MSGPASSNTERVLAFGRLTHHHPYVDDVAAKYLDDDLEKLPVVSPEQGANVVSSLLTNGRHAPCIDLDVPALLFPSSTDGHSHLYIDVELAWQDYLRVLAVLAAVGIVEKGFYESAKQRGASRLRLPHIRKPAADR